MNDIRARTAKEKLTLLTQLKTTQVKKEKDARDYHKTLTAKIERI